MSNYQKRSRARLITAVSLIVASFCSAFILSFMANRSSPALSARVTLIPGHTVLSSDVLAVDVALGAEQNRYFLNNRNIVGSVVLKQVNAGELIPTSAISFAESTQLNSTVPISVHSYDVPADIAVGEKVSLYHVGDPKVSSDVAPAELLIRGAFIVGINSKGQNLGGDLSLTISLQSEQIISIIDATSTGRIVIVRAHS